MRDVVSNIILYAPHILCSSRTRLLPHTDVCATFIGSSFEGVPAGNQEASQNPDTPVWQDVGSDDFGSPLNGQHFPLGTPALSGHPFENAELKTLRFHPRPSECPRARGHER